jgi:uncharacterized protein CbrC (UPF0167 family)
VIRVAELEESPVFGYHPDPVGTGSIKASEQACANCSQRRGFVYTGLVHCEEEVEALRPWCIADGGAAERFDATYCDVFAPPGIDGTVVDAITKRTPGFSGWQQERWLFHCGDARRCTSRRTGRRLSARSKKWITAHATNGVIKQNKVRHAQPCAEQELALSRTREGSQQNSGNKDGRSRRNAVRVPSAGIRINIKRFFGGREREPVRPACSPGRTGIDVCQVRRPM